MIIGSKILQHEKVSSTNSVAAELLKSERQAEGTIIKASWQESGRGQQGNKWESEPGKNLLISIILYPIMIRAEEQFDICRIISLGVYDTLKCITSDVRIKWPNDIYVKNDKIAGILIENSLMGNSINSSIAGIGLNVNQDRFFSDAPNPVSLKMVTGREYDPEHLLEDLCKHTDSRYNMLKEGFHKKLAADYIDALYRFGQWNTFRDKNGEFTGRIKNVRDSGLLVVENENGKRKEYAFKEIEYII